MPDLKTHINQAERNEKIASTLFKTAYVEWGVVALFYSAVHYVEAFLAPQKVHSADHDERNKHVHAQLRSIEPDYHLLRLTSRQARYDGLIPNNDQISECMIAHETIKKRVRAMLGIKD